MVTDRKKEIFKLSNGKFIAPQVIENVFKESQIIDQIMVIGEHEKFASALISPNFKYFDDWKKSQKYPFQVLKNSFSFLKFFHLCLRN